MRAKVLLLAVSLSVVAGAAFAQEQEVTDEQPADVSAPVKLNKYNNALGVRVGLGSVYSVEANYQRALGPRNRLELGFGFEIGVIDEILYFGYGGAAAYQWRFPISRDGLVSWHAGPAVTVGEYGAIDAATLDAGAGIVVGVGGQVGIELNFGNIIDDTGVRFHPFRRWQFGLDMRPVVNVVKPSAFPWLLPSVCLSSRSLF